MSNLVKTFLLTFFALFVISRTILAADCTDVLPGGDLTLTTVCSFEGTVNGIDSGTGSLNTARLILNPGSKLVLLPGQTIAVGSLVFNGGLISLNGGSLKTKTPIWMLDEDGDGYASSLSQYAQAIPPIGAKRRNTIVSTSILDKNDMYYCPKDYNPNIICNECILGDLALQADGFDSFSQCSKFNLCNGNGLCTLHAKRMFISSEVYDGNLNGLSGADQICQSLADSSNLTGSWKAWLSDSIVSATDRLTHSNYPYILVDLDTRISDNWTNLLSINHYAPINKTENGGIVPSSLVWSNSDVNGLLIETNYKNTCNDWTKNIKSRLGVYGQSSLFSTVDWTNSSLTACNNLLRLYCIEQ